MTREGALVTMTEMRGSFNVNLSMSFRHPISHPAINYAWADKRGSFPKVKIHLQSNQHQGTSHSFNATNVETRGPEKSRPGFFRPFSLLRK